MKIYTFMIYPQARRTVSGTDSKLFPSDNETVLHWNYINFLKIYVNDMSWGRGAMKMWFEMNWNLKGTGGGLNKKDRRNSFEY